MNELQQKIKELHDQEAIERQAYEIPFYEFVRPFEEAFNEETKELQQKYFKLMEPEKKKLDEKAAKLRRTYERSIDVAARAFARYQLGLEKEFRAIPEVQAAVKKMEDAIRDRREMFQADLKILAQETDDKIAALKAEYPEDE